MRAASARALHRGRRRSLRGPLNHARAGRARLACQLVAALHLNRRALRKTMIHKRAGTGSRKFCLQFCPKRTDFA